MNKFLILFLTIASVIFNASAEDSFDVKKMCESQKGVWREFGNDCADNCSLDKGRKKMCISNITFSCDCLENKCWNYYQCVDNEQYQIDAKKEQEEKSKKLKDMIPELFQNNQTATTNKNDAKKTIDKAINNSVTNIKSTINTISDNSNVSLNFRKYNNEHKTSVIDKNKKDNETDNNKDANKTTTDNKDTNKNNNETNQNNTTPPNNDTQKSSCSNSGGTWKEFPNGCADSCYGTSTPAVCTSVITESCDCGQDKCWNGSQCTLASAYKPNP